MRILAFPGRLSAKAKAPVRDWSTQEIADFYRAHRLLAENGAGIGIDRGLSDEGEPWMVFFDVVSQDVFLHIARIDGTCKLICEPFNMRLDAADIPSLIAQFEHAVTDYLAIRTERAKNVVIHPAARIIMSISAVFLLFKLENGEAYAKGLSDKVAAPAADRATEKSVTALARAQAAFHRAFDAFEPAHAAMIAGLILASELVVSSLRSTNAEEANVEKLMALALAEHEVAPRDDQLGIESTVVHAAAEAPTSTTIATLAAVTFSVDVSVEVPVAITFTPPESVVSVPTAGPAADFRVAQFLPATIESPVKAPPDVVIAAAETDASKALEYLFTLLPGTASQGDTSSPEPAPLPKIDISLDRLGEISGSFGFVRETHLDVADLFRLLAHYAQYMGGFEFEYRTTGAILIEQYGTEDLDPSKIGMLSNTGADGTVYTIVGRADLIDDVVGFFA